MIDLSPSSGGLQNAVFLILSFLNLRWMDSYAVHNDKTRYETFICPTIFP